MNCLIIIIIIILIIIITIIITIIIPCMLFELLCLLKIGLWPK